MAVHLQVEVRASVGHPVWPAWRAFFPRDMHLQTVLKLWAARYLDGHSAPMDVHAHAGPGGQPLAMDMPLKKVAHGLPLRDGAYLVSIEWPTDDICMSAPPERSSNQPQNSIGRLRISSRYANIDSSASGNHTSSTKQAKIEAGCYASTTGKFPLKVLMDAMRSPPRQLVFDSSALGSLTLTAIGRQFTMERNPLTLSTSHLCTVKIQGPLRKLINFETVCQRLQSQADRPAAFADPFPMFVPSCGRALCANLNWAAGHVYGDFEVPLASDPVATTPVLCVVVEPTDAPAYTERWPQCLQMVLPSDHLGPGFARWAVQVVATHSIVSSTSTVSSPPFGKIQLPFVWLCDDNVFAFYRLTRFVNDQGPSSVVSSRPNKHAMRQKERFGSPTHPMFSEALLAVQGHPLLRRACAAGFLRDDGTAVCKKNEWCSNSLSIYKITCLNLGQLKLLNVQYEPSLMKFEDVAFAHSVIACDGATLKCQSYCFKSCHADHGGCEQQRNSRSKRLSLFDLVPQSTFLALPPKRRQVVCEVLKWARAKEEASATKVGSKRSRPES